MSGSTVISERVLGQCHDHGGKCWSPQLGRRGQGTVAYFGKEDSLDSLGERAREPVPLQPGSSVTRCECG